MRGPLFLLFTVLAACASSPHDDAPDAGPGRPEPVDGSDADADTRSDAGAALDSGSSEGGPPNPVACGPVAGPDSGARVTVDAAAAVRTIPDDLFGFNCQVWDAAQHGTNTQYSAIIKSAGFKVMRWPGGSWGDRVAWNNLQCFASYAATYSQSKALYQQLGIRFQPIANASSDFNWCTQPQTPQTHTKQQGVDLATAWVADGALGAKYWEVGNELYGNWEQGATTGAVYGDYFADYYQAVKKANPAIKVLAVGRPDATACGGCVSGNLTWTTDVLRAAFAKGVVPDGFQIHRYFDPVTTNADLLHSALDSIAQETSFLNSTVGAVTGQYRQLDYAMTEFATRVQPAGSSVDRVPHWISGQFTLSSSWRWPRTNGPRRTPGAMSGAARRTGDIHRFTSTHFSTGGSAGTSSARLRPARTCVRTPASTVTAI